MPEPGRGRSGTGGQGGRCGLAGAGRGGVRILEQLLHNVYGMVTGWSGRGPRCGLVIKTWLCLAAVTGEALVSSEDKMGASRWRRVGGGIGKPPAGLARRSGDRLAGDEARHATIVGDLDLTQPEVLPSSAGERPCRSDRPGPNHKPIGNAIRTVVRGPGGGQRGLAKGRTGLSV